MFLMMKNICNDDNKIKSAFCLWVFGFVILAIGKITVSTCPSFSLLAFGVFVAFCAFAAGTFAFLLLGLALAILRRYRLYWPVCLARLFLGYDLKRLRLVIRSLRRAVIPVFTLLARLFVWLIRFVLPAPALINPPQTGPPPGPPPGLFPTVTFRNSPILLL